MKTIVFVVLASFAIVHGNEKKRISTLKCKEYNESNKKNNICNDGVMYDGVVQLKDHPFVGVIGYDNKGSKSEIEWTCSGTLISDQFVLTAAHCTKNPRTKKNAQYVRLGATDLGLTNTNAKIYIVSEVIRHPEYTANSFYNDIALIKLDKPINFTEYIQPACVYTGEDLPEYNVAGFSFQTDKSETRRGYVLHQKNSVNSKENCSKIWENELKSGVDFDKQFCTNLGHISCTISSGSPLLHREEELRCMQSVAGIVDLGKREICVVKAALNVKVPGFIDWIENIVWPTQQ